MNNNQNINENLNHSEIKTTSGSRESRSEIFKSMRNFRYLGMLVKPYKTLTGEDSTFASISRRLINENDTPEGWDYDEFYSIARTHGAGEVDLFIVRGALRCPASNYFFHYKQ